MTNLLAFSVFLLVWPLGNYAFARPLAKDEPPARPWGGGWVSRLAILSPVCAGSLAVIFRLSAAALWLALWFLACSWGIYLGRRLLIPRSRLAEYETVANSIALFVAASIARSTPQASLVCSPLFDLAPAHLAVLFASAGILLYAMCGGGLIVRGLLEKAGGLPKRAAGIDSTFRHGEIIGQVERLVVILILAEGSPQALAFFFAAKGLIRSKELEDRTMADYFLLGSLASFLVATVCGMLLTRLVLPLWK